MVKEVSPYCFFRKLLPFWTPSWSPACCYCSDRGALLFSGRFVFFSIHWMRKHKQCPFRSHLPQICRRPCLCGLCWCATCINKPQDKNHCFHSSLLFFFFSLPGHILQHIHKCLSRHVFCHFKSGSKACQSLLEFMVTLEASARRRTWPWCAAEPRERRAEGLKKKKKEKKQQSEVNMKMSSLELSTVPLWEGLMVANLAQRETFVWATS